jgi:hypothetical protein
VDAGHIQWLIIQGRAVGELFIASGAPASLTFDAQQPQPPPCALRDDSRGALALRSFTACACRVADDMLASDGAATSARWASIPQIGQGQGRSRRAMVRMVEKSPHSVQR